MFCKNCGNEVPDGIKFCNRCGAPLMTANAPRYTAPTQQNPSQSPNPTPTPNPNPNPNPAPNPNSTPNYQTPPRPPYTPPTPPRQGGGYGAPPYGGSGASGINYGSFLKRGDKQTWLAVLFVLVVLPIIALLSNGVYIGGSGQSVYVNMMSYAMSLSKMIGFDGGTGWYVVYSILAVIDILGFMTAAVAIIKKKAFGILVGLGASALMLIITILMLIIGFCTASMISGGMSGVTSCPGTWIWLSFPISVLSGMFFAVKGKDLVL